METPQAAVCVEHYEFTVPLKLATGSNHFDVHTTSPFADWLSSDRFFVCNLAFREQVTGSDRNIFI